MELEGEPNANTAYLMRKGAWFRIRACHIQSAYHSILICSSHLIDGPRLGSDSAQIIAMDHRGHEVCVFDVQSATTVVRAAARNDRFRLYIESYGAVG
jgi:hypothetical protein